MALCTSIFRSCTEIARVLYHTNHSFVIIWHSRVISDAVVEARIHSDPPPYWKMPLPISEKVCMLVLLRLLSLFPLRSREKRCVYCRNAWINSSRDENRVSEEGSWESEWFSLDWLPGYRHDQNGKILDMHRPDWGRQRKLLSTSLFMVCRSILKSNNGGPTAFLFGNFFAGLEKLWREAWNPFINFARDWATKKKK